MLLYQLPLGIHCEYSVQWNTHFFIGVHILKSHTHRASPPTPSGAQDPNSSFPVKWTHSRSVAKSSVEGFSVWIEQMLYVGETLNLKLLWLLLNHLPAQHNMTSNTLRR